MFDLLGGTVNEHIQGPDHAGDGDDMERHRAHDLPALTGRHLQPLPLSQRLQLDLHDELVLAELTAARVRALDPLLQARLMHEVQAPRAAAGGDQRALVVPLTVADPADVLIGRRDRRAREGGHRSRRQRRTPSLRNVT